MATNTNKCARLLRAGLVTLASPLLFILMAGLLTGAGSLSLGGNIALQVVAAMIVALLAVWWIGRDAVWALGLGLGSTLGLLAIYTLLASNEKQSVRSSLVLFGLVCLAPTFAALLTHRHRVGYDDGIKEAND